LQHEQDRPGSEGGVLCKSGIAKTTSGAKPGNDEQDSIMNCRKADGNRTQVGRETLLRIVSPAAGEREESFVLRATSSDGRGDWMQVDRGWHSYPTCISTRLGWSISNLSASVY
jgi:hypothetical protein